MALTDTKVKAVKVHDDGRARKHTDSKGLYLWVNKSGKYWWLDYAFCGKWKTLAFGIYLQVSLKQARAAREQVKELLAEGIDPNQAKKEDKRRQIVAAQAATFEGVAMEWMAKKEQQLKASTIKHRKAELDNHILPWLGKMKVDRIKPMDVLDV
ncbi:MAG: integrase arm-type DNA-binding domain-containing protein, partial [Ghiorsea sp.]|nr:integrase arm-type DNA-binding domain-containing protein [Ghiorsea sp.]